MLMQSQTEVHKHTHAYRHTHTLEAVSLRAASLSKLILFSEYHHSMRPHQIGVKSGSCSLVNNGESPAALCFYLSRWENYDLQQKGSKNLFINKILQHMWNILKINPPNKSTCSVTERSIKEKSRKTSGLFFINISELSIAFQQVWVPE